MGPRLLQQQIHSTFSPSSGVWGDFRAEVDLLYNAASNYADYSNHLIREFNRKVLYFGFQELAYEPYDGGYRFISSPTGPVFVYTINGSQVFTDLDEKVQVSASYANS